MDKLKVSTTPLKSHANEPGEEASDAKLAGKEEKKKEDLATVFLSSRIPIF